MLRIGMRMQLPKKYNAMTYFGMGSWENYQDRKHSTFVQVNKSSVSDQYVPYTRSSENGYKTEVKGVSLVKQQENGLLSVVKEIKNGADIGVLYLLNVNFVTAASLNYGASNSVDEKHQINGIAKVNKTKHTIDLKEKDLAQLNTNLVQ